MALSDSKDLIFWKQYQRRIRGKAFSKVFISTVLLDIEQSVQQKNHEPSYFLGLPAFCLAKRSD